MNRGINVTEHWDEDTSILYSLDAPSKALYYKKMKVGDRESLTAVVGVGDIEEIWSLEDLKQHGIEVEYIESLGVAPVDGKGDAALKDENEHFVASVVDLYKVVGVNIQFMFEQDACPGMMVFRKDDLPTFKKLLR